MHRREDLRWFFWKSKGWQPDGLMEGFFFGDFLFCGWFKSMQGPQVLGKTC